LLLGKEKLIGQYQQSRHPILNVTQVGYCHDKWNKWLTYL